MKALLSLDLLGLNYYTLAIVAGLAIVVPAASNQVRPFAPFLSCSAQLYELKI